MEGIFLSALFGATIGVGLAILWFGVDLLFGLQTFSEARAAGLMMVTAILAPIGLGVLWFVVELLPGNR